MPLLSGFTAVPNPVMLSFMGAQSFIMMYMAGEAWQFGKRKIGAMSNEEFNKLTPLELLKMQQSTLKEAIPSMEQSMRDMQPMVRTVAAEMVKAIPQITAGLAEGVTSIINPSENAQTTITPGATQAGLLSGATPGVIQPGLDFWQNFWNALINAVKSAGVPGITTSIITGSTEQQQEQQHKTQQLLDQIAIEENNQRAIDAMAAFKSRQESSKEAARSPQISTVHQTATQQFKPKAGQTQIQERARLTKLILQQANQFKQAKATLAKYSQSTEQLRAQGISISPASKANFRANAHRTMLLATAAIKRTQTLLSGLVGRYRW